MSPSIKSFAPVLLTFSLLAACAAKPPQVQPLASTSDVTQELDTTQRMINEQKANNLDVLAPQSFERAQDRLNKAREQAVEGQRSEKILQNIAESRAWLKEAQSKGEVTRAAAKGVSEARTAALQANAQQFYQKEFLQVDKDVRDMAEEAEKGDLDKATKKGSGLAKRYHDLEIQSVTKNFLSQAQDNLKTAQAEGAEKNAPKTYRQAETKINQTLALIYENPRNIAAIRQASMEATEASRYLLRVHQKTKQGNTEDLVLQTERQRETISGLAEGLAASSAELSHKEAALKTAEELRQDLKPEDAEVYVEGDRVKVRLKGVQFGSNQAALNKNSTALLEKVDKALGDLGVSQVIVEGHTDSVGSSQVNREISQKRAEAVQKYFASQGRVEAEKVRAIGRGSEDPIADNKTQRGRAQNRRIDLVIEPGMKTRVE